VPFLRDLRLASCISLMSRLCLPRLRSMYIAARTRHNSIGEWPRVMRGLIHLLEGSTELESIILLHIFPADASSLRPMTSAPIHLPRLRHISVIDHQSHSLRFMQALTCPALASVSVNTRTEDTDIPLLAQIPVFTSYLHVMRDRLHSISLNNLGNRYLLTVSPEGDPWPRVHKPLSDRQTGFTLVLHIPMDANENPRPDLNQQLLDSMLDLAAPVAMRELSIVSSGLAPVLLARMLARSWPMLGAVRTLRVYSLEAIDAVRAMSHRAAEAAGPASTFLMSELRCVRFESGALGFWSRDSVNFAQSFRSRTLRSLLKESLRIRAEHGMPILELEFRDPVGLREKDVREIREAGWVQELHVHGPLASDDEESDANKCDG
jgi:hypothetical protein